ncbi:hypothetical protein [Rothia uropygialis]|nr:hypothetical protein [Kocuria sp. 36]
MQRAFGACASIGWRLVSKLDDAPEDVSGKPAPRLVLGMINSIVGW